MAKVAVGATRVVVCAPVVPIANHTRGENQQRDERQGNPEYSNRLSHSVLGRPEPGDRPIEY
jgi:hypothetical protein